MKKWFPGWLMLFLLWSITLPAQQITLDSNGRVTQMKLPDKPAPFAISISSRFDNEAIWRGVSDALSEKLDATVRNLKDTGQAYLQYYDQLWTTTVRAQVVKELEAIGSWLKDEQAIVTAVHLRPFFTALQQLRAAAGNKGFYELNGRPLGSRNTVTTDVYDDVVNAYHLKITANSLYNKFLTDLFRTTFPLADNSGLNQLSATDFNTTTETALKTLLDRAQQLSGVHVNNMDSARQDAIFQLDADVNANPVVTAVQGSAYFKNWVWMRKGEPTINPFELKAKDEARGRQRPRQFTRNENKSLLGEMTRGNRLLNDILLPADDQKNVRNIHYFRLGAALNKTNEIKTPVRGNENVKINMHNTGQEERLELLLLSKEAHSGRNNFVTGLDTSVSMLLRVITLMNPTASLWGTVGGLLGGAKSAAEAEAFTGAMLLRDSVRPVTVIWSALETDLRKLNMYNAFLFESSKKCPDVIRLVHEGKVDEGETYIRHYVECYMKAYDGFATALERLSIDSLVIANTYTAVWESNLPPSDVSLAPPSATPLFRTEILETGEVDEDVTSKYAVRSYFSRPDTAAKRMVKDSLMAATFSIKNGKLKWVDVSAGLAFTLPNKYYGINTVTFNTNAAPTITTKRETVSVVAGLNIYVARINMLDDHWFHSPKCPFYSRLSFFVGLNIPDVMNHFYPGISYDLIPGFKLVGGVHLYRHTKYRIRNNAETDKTVSLHDAGPFLSLNISPDILLKGFNVFKK